MLRAPDSVLVRDVDYAYDLNRSPKSRREVVLGETPLRVIRTHSKPPQVAIEQLYEVVSELDTTNYEVVGERCAFRYQLLITLTRDGRVVNVILSESCPYVLVFDDAGATVASFNGHCVENEINQLFEGLRSTRSK